MAKRAKADQNLAQAVTLSAARAGVTPDDFINRALYNAVLSQRTGSQALAVDDTKPHAAKKVHPASKKIKNLREPVSEVDEKVLTLHGLAAVIPLA